MKTSALFCLATLSLTYCAIAQEEPWLVHLEHARNAHAACRFTEAEEDYRASLLELENAGEESSRIAAVQNCMGNLYQDRAQFHEAERLYHCSLEIITAQDDAGLEKAICLSNLAQLYCEMACFEKAEEYAKLSINMVNGSPKATTIQVAKALNNLALIKKAQGDPVGAEILYLKVLELTEHSEDSIRLAGSLNNLALLYCDRGCIEKARLLATRAWSLLEKNLIDNELEAAICANNLAKVLNMAGERDAAERLANEALERLVGIHGYSHPLVAACVSNIGMILMDRARLPQAEVLLKAAVKINEDTLGKGHPRYAESLANLAILCDKMGDMEKADRLFQDSIRILEEVYENESHPMVKKVRAEYSGRMQRRESNHIPAKQ